MAIKLYGWPMSESLVFESLMFLLSVALLSACEDQRCLAEVERLDATADIGLVDAGQEDAEDAADPEAPAAVRAWLQGRPEIDRDRISWDYNPVTGVPSIGIGDDGQVFVYPDHACVGFREPRVGQLTGAELETVQHLFARVGAFDPDEVHNYLTCERSSSGAMEMLYLSLETGQNEILYATPAFQPTGLCAIEQSPYVYYPRFSEGVLQLTDWLHAKLFDPEFTAQLAPAVPQRVFIRRMDPEGWAQMGRPIPPTVAWTIDDLSLNALAAEDPSQIHYAGPNTEQLWDLCVSGYAQWALVPDRPECIERSVFAALEGETTHLVTCSAPPAGISDWSQWDPMNR